MNLLIKISLSLPLSWVKYGSIPRPRAKFQVGRVELAVTKIGRSRSPVSTREKFSLAHNIYPTESPTSIRILNQGLTLSL